MKKQTEEESINQKDKDLCLEEDFFLEEKTIWVVELSDGKTVYQDDHRDGLSEPIAWKRLRSYCEENATHIESMKLKFRSHSELVGHEVKDISGRYFSYGITKNITGDDSYEYYIAGYVVGENLVCHWYKIPEIIKCDTKTRKITERDLKNPSLIINQTH